MVGYHKKALISLCYKFLQCNALYTVVTLFVHSDFWSDNLISS